MLQAVTFCAETDNLRGPVRLARPKHALLPVEMAITPVRPDPPPGHLAHK